MTHQQVQLVAEQIRDNRVRGVTTIARETARALEVQAEETEPDDPEEFLETMREATRRLYEARPEPPKRSIGLTNTLRYVFQNIEGETAEDLRTSTIAVSRSFREDIKQARDTLGEIGSHRLGDGDTVMTHCHSTDALSAIKHALEDGKSIDAFVKETRPQKGGHITAQTLREWDVPVTFIVDGAEHRYLDEVDHVVVGAESIAADGSVVNRIGSAGLAVNAREKGVPVTAVAQTLKLDPDALTGHDFDMKMRDESEVIDDRTREQIGDIRVKNPAFDVTPPRYVDAIVTERGQFPPESIVVLMRELYGDTGKNPWDD
ncbi:MAG: ribose 1,5-bisphosphate isomerase [Haloarculaceae archaeon]